VRGLTVAWYPIKNSTPFKREDQKTKKEASATTAT